MRAPGRGFAATVASNSFWNLLQSLVAAVVGIAVSILTARYLGSNDFGVLSYVVWLATMLTTVTDLGLEQVLRKYVPAWFHQTDTRTWAIRLVWRAIAIQLAMAGLIVGALIVFFPWWSRSLTIAHSKLELVMAIGLVSVVPVVVSRCVGTFLRSIQSTRDLAVVSLASQATNLALVAGAVLLRLPLVALVTAGLISQSVLALGLIAALRRRDGPAVPQAGRWPTRELTRYALIAYANVLLQQVVWSRSETFFLGLFSPAREVGFYGLAYGVAGMIGGLIGVSQQALFAAQFELLAVNQEARSDRLASLSIKYLGLLFLPLCLVIWFFMDSVVLLLYGPAYRTVARVFPLVLFGTVVANILNPIATKVHLSNRKFAATLGIGLAGAVLSITLDLLLIPTHHAFGAAVANCLSQVCVVGIGMTFVAMVSPVRIELRPLGAVALVNVLLGGLFWLVLSHSNILALKLAVTAVAATVYLRWLAAWGVFGDADRALLGALEEGAPGWLRPMIRLVRGSVGRVAAG